MACTNLRPEATDPSVGFYCKNDDQRPPNQPPLTTCLDLCAKNGQADKERKISGPNCQRCADFKVRYFCLTAEYDCTGSKRDEDDWKRIDAEEAVFAKKDADELHKVLRQNKELPKSKHVLKKLLNAATREVQRERLREGLINNDNGSD